MAMSRKTYRNVAEIIKAQVDSAQYMPESRAAVLTTASQIARELGAMFKIDNTAFRYDTFFEACGLDEYGHVR